MSRMKVVPVTIFRVMRPLMLVIGFCLLINGTAPTPLQIDLDHLDEQLVTVGLWDCLQKLLDYGRISQLPRLFESVEC